MMGFMEYVIERPKQLARIDPKVFDTYTGKYDLGNNRLYAVTREGDRYFGRGPAGIKAELLPVTETKFFIADFEEAITFVKDEKGEVVAISVEQNGRAGSYKKIKDSAAGSGQQ